MTDRGFRADLEDLAARGLLRERRDCPPAGADFTSNDYLGLARDPRIAAALAEAATTTGVGAGAARLLTGAHPHHRALERAAAALVGFPDALLFNTGYCANVGLLQAIAGPGDAIFSDALNHASIIDGCRLSHAAVHIYEHASAEQLAQLLAGVPARRRVIVTESLFGMDGDVAPLLGLRAVADRHGALLVVDEAHALGVLGPRGGGLCRAEHVAPDAVVGTLGKALGTFGAFVAGSPDLVTWLCNRARSFVFTTALPPAIAAASVRALDLASGPEGDHRRARLVEHRTRVAAALRDLRLPVPPATAPILPIRLGSPEAALRAALLLAERGILALPIRPPTVPPGTARLRLSLSAAHTPHDLDRLVEALGELRSVL